MSAQHPLAESRGHTSTSIGSPAGKGTAAWLVAESLPHRCDDHLGRQQRAALPADIAHRRAHVLGEQRSAVHAQGAVDRRRAAEKRLGRGRGGLRGALRPADAVHLFG